MSIALAQTFEGLTNPLDLVEEIVMANDWLCDRHGVDEMVCQKTGHWCDYALHFLWQEEVSAFHFSCFFDVHIPENRLPEVHHLLSLLNDKLWMGHFYLSQDKRMVGFRHTTLLKGVQYMAPEVVEDLLQAGLAACDRYYPAFQFVVWGDKKAGDAMQSAMLETEGEA